jgi:hypothetical protein
MYSPEQLQQILDEKDVIIPKTALVFGQYQTLSSRLPLKAQEHCQHGVCRRLLIIYECLVYFFSEIPPNTTKERTREENSRANIHLHAFLINVSGIIDNMAWLWAYYLGLEDRVDLEKKKTMIGLFNKDFSEHLPDRLATLVDQYLEWYTFMINHRHPTAHRIPPYVIPYTNIDEKDPPDSRDYTPRYIHSFDSRYGPIPLHAQALADTNTILSLLDTMLIELKERRA